jgi:uncharacterized protein
MEIISFFFVGLFGSLHCIGMCGPIVLAIPPAYKYDLIKKILYNLGRVITYSLMGLGAGFIGNRFFMAGLQQDISIIFGAVIILYVLIPYPIKAKISNSSVVSALYNPLKKQMSSLFVKRSMPSYLTIGLLNGLLPCGFVYVALAAAAVTGTPGSGAFGMALFGLGTVPAIFTFSIIGRFITTGFRSRIKKFIPALAVVLGIIFILRGLNLGIPYVSPKISGNIHSVTEIDCCK